VTSRGGLRRPEALWKALGKAALLRDDAERPGSEVPSEPVDGAGDRLVRLLLLTSHLPDKGDGLKALHAAGPRMFWDAVRMLDDGDVERLAAYASGDRHRPLPGFWSEPELGDLG
jgi:hypothetical protein